MKKEYKEALKTLGATIIILLFWTVAVWHVAIITNNNAQIIDFELLKIDYENCQWDLLTRNAEIGKLERQIDSLRNDDLKRYKYIESEK